MGNKTKNFQKGIKWKKFHGYLDYDWDELHESEINERIIWLKLRLAKTCINPIKQLYKHGLVKDKRSLPKWDFHIPIAILMIISIEMLSAFFEGDIRKTPRKKSNFVKFMDEYFDVAWKNKFFHKQASKVLYEKFRNDLTHSFYVRGFFERKQTDYIESVGDELISVDFDKFLDDFFRAIDKYFDDLENNRGLKEKFNRRFTKLLKDTKGRNSKYSE